jgi:hypothetical protein
MRDTIFAQPACKSFPKPKDQCGMASPILEKQALPPSAQKSPLFPKSATISTPVGATFVRLRHARQQALATADDEQY